ncbi:MAG: hypothetical protein RIK87_19625 [Fuerstiella sp.]
MKTELQDFFRRNTASFLVGVAAAGAVVQTAVSWTLICGLSVPAVLTLCACGATGCLLATRTDLPAAGARTQTGLVIGLTALAWSLPNLLNKLLNTGTATFQSAWLPFLLPGIIVVLSTTLLIWWMRQPRRTVTSFSMCCVGAAVGLLIPLLPEVAPLPMDSVPMAAVVTAVLGIELGLRWLPAAQTSLSTQTPSDDSEYQPAEITSALRDWPLWLQTFSVGFAAHVALRCFGFQMPLTPGLLCVAAAMVLLTLSASGWTAFARFTARRHAGIGMLVLFSLCPLLTEPLIRLNLYLNATIVPGILLAGLRALQVGLLLSILAVLYCCGRSSAFVQRRSSKSVNVWGWLLPGFAAASTLITLDIAVEFLAAVLLLTVSLALVQHRLATASDARTSASPRWLSAAPIVVAITAVALAPFDSAASVPLLFNTRSAHAYRIGLDPQLISQSHSIRLLEQHATSTGELTVWRTVGDQVELRRNGLPIGLATANAMTTPQPVSGTLATLIPLVLHPNAGRVLLLNDDAGVGLRTCCEFPVHTIRAVRSDPETTDVARRLVWNSLPVPPDDDDRVTISYEPVATAVRRQSAEQRWDVVVTSPPDLGAAAAGQQLTQEFYQAASGLLAADGIFCQHISHYSHGAEPLVKVLSTVVRVFDRAVVVRMAPGEFAVIAGNAPEKLLDNQILDRLQKDHVGRQLSRSGWDWSQVAALPVVDTADPVGIFEHTELRPSSTVATAGLAFALIRSGGSTVNGSAEIRATFAPHQQRLADAAPRGDAYAEFARRYSAVVQQTEILTNFPDQPWTYRKSLKTEMQRNPRPAVQKVADGRITQAPHPLDEHRKNYFITLGEVLQQAREGQVDPLLLRKLSDFTAHYEPLLSHFAHHELIRIHEAAAHPGPALELRHRLHTVYYTEGTDWSVRQVADAMKQILEDPELLATDELRFDHVNSMLQELVRRWEGRRDYHPPSARRTQRDVDECVRIANLALDAMEQWAEAVNLTAEDMRLRRRFINAALISPLRDYREQVLAHRIKTEPLLVSPAAQPDDTDADDLPMLLNPGELATN